MHTPNPRVLKNLIYKFLPGYITEDEVVIPEWESYTGIHVAPNVIELDSGAHTLMHMGEHWRAGYDDTRYFKASVTVPAAFAGRKVYLDIDFGGEALVRINGKIAGAVSSREQSGWVGRNEIIFNKPFSGGEVLNIELEATVDSAAFCNAAIAGQKSLEYTLSHACLRLINEEAENLWYDMSGAYSVYEKGEDRYAAKRLYNAVDTAMHMLAFDLGKEAFYAAIPAAEQFFWDAVGKINAKTPGEVILCGHSHLDVAWLWTVKEINRKTARTFANNCALMDNYPDFRFSQSQAVLYSFIKEHYPEIYENVKRHVKSKNWEITGNTWVEADTNLASGESLIRQLLYGRKFFMQEFGVSSDIYWLPDCFGFTAALPQIIARSGMKYFFTSKLQYNDTNEFPLSVFKWRSHSGDEVIAYMQKVPYEGEGNADYAIRTRSTNCQNDIVDASMGMFGYGDGGGGCTLHQVERIRRLEKLSGIPSVREGSASEFFEEISKSADELPVWDGEMYYENHRGTFTSQAFIKKNNRFGEYRLRYLEMLSLVAGDYRSEELESAWKLLLINQFHDILPGTSIHEAIENTREEYKELEMRYEKIEKRLSSLIVNGDKNTVTVFNPHAWGVSANVKIPAIDNGFCIYNAENEAMPGVLYDDYYVFTAKNVPPLGYRQFYIKPGELAVKSVYVTDTTLENEFLSVKLNKNGTIASVFDKENNREVLSSDANLLSISHDKPIHESAWNLEADYKMNMCYLNNAVSVKAYECTSLRGVIKTVYSYNKSVITQLIVLEAGSHCLKFVTTVDWHEREKVLKAEFPLLLRSRMFTCEIAHGALERPTYANNTYERAMFEVCAHKWADLSEGDYGVSLINDCKYGYDVDNNVMRITLMRGPVLPDAMGDIGVSEFTYALYPHVHSWNEANTVHEAFELNDSLKAYMGSVGNSQKSYMRVLCDHVVVDAVKQAEDGNGIILRMYESNARRGRVEVCLPEGAKSVTECNLMEIDEKDMPVKDGCFAFDIKPFEVRAFRIK